jgi:flagellar protein FlgJ
MTPINPNASSSNFPLASSLSQPAVAPPERPEVQEKFTEFVGQTMFGSMLATMRKSVSKSAYMHGGRTEEVFQQQLDQHIVKDLTEASADTISDPMFELFNLQRRS